MENSILYGVGKKVRNGYLNGQIPESTVLSMYKRNKKEADAFSVFGFKTNELIIISKETHNPLLKVRLDSIIKCIDQYCGLTSEDKKAMSKKSNIQNDLSIQKLEMFKKEALGIGLRKVLSRLRKESKITKDPELTLTLMLLETEFANLSAKENKGKKKGAIYERKSHLLYQMSSYLNKLGWRYGINDAAGKNASYLVYVYLPNGVQLTWHTNDYDIYEYYPQIDAEWDGQVCMTMEKILNFIKNRYYIQTK